MIIKMSRGPIACGGDYKLLYKLQAERLMRINKYSHIIQEIQDRKYKISTYLLPYADRRNPRILTDGTWFAASKTRDPGESRTQEK